MTDLERRALMGDRQAQEECTEKGIVLACPWCGWNGKVSFKDHRFCGQNYRGSKKIVYRIQVICNKCRSRGKPIFTEPLINPNPYITKWGKKPKGLLRMWYMLFQHGTPAQRRRSDGVGSANIKAAMFLATLMCCV